jgi:hypothetical protein
MAYPTSAAPYPTSAARYPTSGTPYPTSAAPYPGFGTVTAAKPRLSPWIWVLAGLSVVLVAVAGGFGRHYLNVRAANEQAIADRAAQIEELEGTLRRMANDREDLDSEQAQVLTALAETGLLVRDHEACPDAVTEFFDTEDGSAEEDAAFDAMLAACDVAL